jgi:hypothetical protein
MTAGIRVVGEVSAPTHHNDDDDKKKKKKKARKTRTRRSCTWDN